MAGRNVTCRAGDGAVSVGVLRSAGLLLGATLPQTALAARHPLLQEEPSDEAAEGAPHDERFERQHDVAALVVPRGFDVAAFDLWPQQWLEWIESDARLGGGRGPQRAGIVAADVLVDWVGARCDLPIEADRSEPFKLRVVGTAAEHAQVAQLLAQLRTAVLDDTRLELRLLEGAAVLDAPLFLPQAASEARLAAALARGPAQLAAQETLALADGLVVATGATSVRTLQTGFSLEICHGAVIHQALTGFHHEGLRARVRGRREPGAARLDLAWNWTAPHGRTRRTVVEPLVWYASPLPHEFDHWPKDELADALKKLKEMAPFQFLDPVELEIDRHVDAFASGATTVPLPDGMALWWPLRLATASGERAVTLVAEVKGSSRHAPRAAIAGRRGFMPFDDEFAPMTFLPLAPVSFRRGRIFADGEPLDADALDARIDDPPASAPASAPAPAVFELRGRVRLDGEVRLEFALPATEDELASLLCGFTGHHLAYWNLDVANQATGATPEFEPWLDGVALDVWPRTLTDGRIELELGGVVQLLRGTPALTATGNRFAPQIEPLHAERVNLAERVVVAPVDGVGRVELGGWPIALEFEVRGIRVPGPSPDEPVADGPDVAPFIDLHLAPVAWTDGDLEDVPVGEPALWPRLKSFDPEVAPDVASQQRAEVRLIGGRPLVDHATVLPVGEADRRLHEAQRAGEVGLLRRASGALQPGRAVLCDSATRHDSIRSFQAGIAHGAVGYEEFQERSPRGLVASLVAVPIPGATRLDYALRAEVPRPPAVLVARSRPLLGSPFPHTPIFRLEECPLRIDLQQRHLFSVAGSVELPDGHALLLPCRVQTERGECAGTLELRVVGMPPASLPTELAEAAARQLGGFALPDVVDDALFVDFHRASTDEDGWPARAVHRVVDGDDPVPPFGAPWRLDVVVRREGRVAAELSTLTVPDRTAVVWCGALGNYLREWDIDTAGEAKIGTPEMQPCLDGVFVVARTGSPTAERVTLELRGVVSLLAGPPRTVEFDNPDGPLLQQVEFLRRTLDTAIEVPLRDGIGRVELPGHPLAIEVVLTRS